MLRQNITRYTVVEGRLSAGTKGITLVEGSVGYVRAQFEVDESFEFDKIIVIFANVDKKLQDSARKTDKPSVFWCPVPTAMIKSGEYEVALVGVDEANIIQGITNKVKQKVIGSLTEEGAEIPELPEPNVWATIQGFVDKWDDVLVTNGTGTKVLTDDGTYKTGGGGGGTYDHSVLENREAENAHPMSAITGLLTKFGDYSTKVAADGLYAAKTYEHLHSNKSILDATQVSFTTALKNTYDIIVGNSHVHNNREALDGLTAAKTTNWDAAYTHTSLKNNPHVVTKTQVGLGNVDNTADIDKPVSTATQVALNAKSDTTHNHDGSYDSIGSATGALTSAKAYTDGKIQSIGSMVVLKGRVDTVELLPTTHSIGDLWLVGLENTAEMAEYVWTEELKWEKFGTTTAVDLSGYATHAEVSDADVVTLNTAKAYTDQGIGALNLADSVSVNNQVYQQVGGLVTLPTLVAEETDPTVPAWAKQASKPSYTAAEVGAEASGEVSSHNSSGTAHSDIRSSLSAKADLVDGTVPANQLPSYVDDVLEYATVSSLPATGIAGKIYVTLDNNLTYRWSGSGYAEISQSLALGETSATAYRGDRGKIAYDHSQGAHAPADAEKNVQSDWNVSDNTSDAYIANKPTLTNSVTIAGSTYTQSNGTITIPDIVHTVKLTQAQYDALSNKDDNTNYMIVGA